MAWTPKCVRLTVGSIATVGRRVMVIDGRGPRLQANDSAINNNGTAAL